MPAAAVTECARVTDLLVDLLRCSYAVATFDCSVAMSAWRDGTKQFRTQPKMPHNGRHRQHELYPFKEKFSFPLLQPDPSCCSCAAAVVLRTPGHDYKGRCMSSIGEEKRNNPRLTKSREGFIELMRNLNLPHPKQIARSLPANMKVGRPTSTVTFVTSDVRGMTDSCRCTVHSSHP